MIGWRTILRLGTRVQLAGMLQFAAVAIIAVEDSGPGIPEVKKKLLFQKYQESLDMLSQGTVSGRFVCRVQIARVLKRSLLKTL